METKRTTLKVAVFSDLHTEFTKFKCKYLDWVAFGNEIDAIVLAGDISSGMGARNWLYQINRKRVKKGLSIVPILMIFGNHEGYSKTWTLEWSRHKWKKLSDEGKIPGLIFLDNSSVVIKDVLFLGTTLWTDLKEAVETNRLNSIEGKMNDFRQIPNWSSEIQIQEHELSKDFIQKELPSKEEKEEKKGEQEPKYSKICVITHHLPTMSSIDSKTSSFLDCACASELDEFKSNLGQDIDVWIHGHTHTSLDYHWKFQDKITRVVCNPRGYSQRGGPENLNFDPKKVIEI